MRPIATEGIRWSVGPFVCRSVGHDRNPCKSGRTDRDAVWDVDSFGPKDPYNRLGLDPPCEEAILTEIMLGFSRTLPSTVPSGHDVGIFPHDVDERSDWPVAESVECYTTFAYWKIPLRCGLSSKFSEHVITLLGRIDVPIVTDLVA